MHNFVPFEIYCYLFHREPPFYEAPVASFINNINNLSKLSADYLSVSYGMPSQPIYCTSMDFVPHLLANKIWTLEFQAGNLAFWEPAELCYTVHLDLF